MRTIPSDAAIEAGIPPSGAGAPFVLLASPLATESTEAFRRAHELARSLAGELAFLRVSSRSFNASTKVCVTPGRSVLNRSGDFLSVVADTAKVLQPSLVAIPELCGQTGRFVHDLAIECDVPILVARRATESKLILVATDLANPTFPVLHAGALLSASLRVRLVFLHNLAPTFSYGDRTNARLRGCPPSVLDRLEALTFAAHAFNVESDNVVTIAPDVDEALMSVIQRERPDIVIVGARDRRHLNSNRASLAQTIYDESAPSVVIVPLCPSRAPLSGYGTS
ncbi:MAG TPA: universal stress protein [Polyangiaceae bacterium]|jgi:hypothetical protein|nr:universal stress protein [Polyangiaceae bacterium]